jgi:UDP-N-acetylglucosamine--dolichyl-phosphate N-acetylglucosaminephosphotransferase
MAILGIADDIFDIRWRHKVFLPAIASIPLLMVYYVDFNVTVVTIPTPLVSYLPRLIDLGIYPLRQLMTGWLYYAYMAFLSIFCTNTINILAGVNGIEAGQSIVIALCIVANDILYVIKPGHPATDAHLFSLYFLLPFIGVSLALLYHNWYLQS